VATIALTTLSPLLGDAGDDNVAHVAPGFGLTSSGTAYYDPDGAAAGEHAVLIVTPTGLSITNQKPATLYGVDLAERPPLAARTPAPSPILRNATCGPVDGMIPPVRLAAIRTPLEVPERPAPPTIRVPHCRRCRVQVQHTGMCRVCTEQADLRTVGRLRERTSDVDEIAEQSGIDPPRVKYLIAKNRRMRRIV
jgi:hypothetical protein